MQEIKPNKLTMPLVFYTLAPQMSFPSVFIVWMKKGGDSPSNQLTSLTSGRLCGHAKIMHQSSLKRTDYVSPRPVAGELVPFMVL